MDRGPMDPLHTAAIMLLIKMLVLATNDRAMVGVQVPLRLDDHSRPVPDFTVTKFIAGFHAKTQVSMSDILLVIEASSTSLNYDRTVKARLYGRFNLPEYWIVDLANKSVRVHRVSCDTGYRQGQDLDAPGTLEIGARQDVRLDFSWLAE